MNAVWIKKKIGTYVTFNMINVNKKAGWVFPAFNWKSVRFILHPQGLLSRGYGRYTGQWMQRSPCK